MTAFKVETIVPQDLLDAARTIPTGDISTCNWLVNWIPSAEYLQWARRGLADDDAHGRSNAITYAKRAVASRIDALVLFNHLRPFLRSLYRRKIEALNRVGIDVPDVVHELVIDPRNDLEHEYSWPEASTARHAVGVADLFLRATQAEYERTSIVALQWSVNGSQLISPAGEVVTFRGFGPRTMLFVDVFEDVPTAKIIDPAASEIRAVPLADFDGEQALTLAGLLRRSYGGSHLSQSGRGPTYYREMKRQGQF
jgi:hypothetical protein